MFDSLASMIKYRDFKQIKVLGSGVHGRAVLLQSPDGTELAVSKDAFVGGIGREELRRMEREVRILSMLNHPYIIAYRCCFQRDDLLCIVTEYAGGGNLKELIRQHRFGNEPFSSGQVIIWLLMTASDCH
jgi:serine/threonine protein kinase